VTVSRGELTGRSMRAPGLDAMFGSEQICLYVARKVLLNVGGWLSV